MPSLSTLKSVRDEPRLIPQSCPGVPAGPTLSLVCSVRLLRKTNGSCTTLLKVACGNPPQMKHADPLSHLAALCACCRPPSLSPAGASAECGALGSDVTWNTHIYHFCTHIDSCVPTNRSVCLELPVERSGGRSRPAVQSRPLR